MDRTTTNRDTRTVPTTKAAGLRAMTSVRVTVRTLRTISKGPLMASKVPVTISRIVAMTSRGFGSQQGDTGSRRPGPPPEGGRGPGSFRGSRQDTTGENSDTSAS